MLFSVFFVYNIFWIYVVFYASLSFILARQLNSIQSGHSTQFSVSPSPAHHLHGTCAAAVTARCCSHRCISASIGIEWNLMELGVVFYSSKHKYRYSIHYHTLYFISLYFTSICIIRIL